MTKWSKIFVEPTSCTLFFLLQKGGWLFRGCYQRPCRTVFFVQNSPFIWVIMCYTFEATQRNTCALRACKECCAWVTPWPEEYYALRLARWKGVRLLKTLTKPKTSRHEQVIIAGCVFVGSTSPGTLIWLSVKNTGTHKTLVVKSKMNKTCDPRSGCFLTYGHFKNCERPCDALLLCQNWLYMTIPGLFQQLYTPEYSFSAKIVSFFTGFSESLTGCQIEYSGLGSMVLLAPDAWHCFISPKNWRRWWPQHFYQGPSPVTFSGRISNPSRLEKAKHGSGGFQ